MSFSFTEQAQNGATRDELEYDYQLSENVVTDLVEYSRSNTVDNEEQFIVTTLSYFTGFMESPKHFTSYVLIGTAGSGKSHLQNTIEDLLPDGYLYQATTGSKKSLIYDDTWEDAYFASLDEMNKPSEDIIEILKSLHGGEDEEFRYKVTGDGRGADRDVDEIVRSAIPYGFLYAQYEPDFELWDRLIKIPVHESKDKNEGVARTQWDHSMISFGNSDVDYMFEFEDGTNALTDHIREMPKDAEVKIPAGESEFGWDAFEHARSIFDINRSETNRVSSQVANLVRASALVNYKNREIINDVIIAEPQDLANVLSCRDVLLATTHQIDRKRKAICLAIQQAGGTQQAASINDIQNYLRKTNASFVKRPQIEAMLADLEDNYMVEKMEGAGERGRNLYQFQSWQNLGKFNITDEFKRVFADCHDPITGHSFIETARRINDDLTPTATDFEADDVEITSANSATAADGSQATLSGDPSTDQSDEPDLEPYEQAVREALRETVDGVTISNLDEHEPSLRELLGAVPMGERDDVASIEGTLFDPDHEVWQHGPDEWIQNTQDAETEIEKAIRRLTVEGIFQTSTTKSRAGQPLEMKVHVE